MEKPNSSNVSPEARLQADKVAPTKVLLCGEIVKSYSATQTLCYIILNCLDVGVVEGNDSGKQSAPKIFSGRPGACLHAPPVGAPSRTSINYYNYFSLSKVTFPSLSHNTPPFISHFVDFANASINLVSSLAAFSFVHSIFFGASGVKVTV